MTIADLVHAIGEILLVNVLWVIFGIASLLGLIASILAIIEGWPAWRRKWLD